MQKFLLILSCIPTVVCAQTTPNSDPLPKNSAWQDSRLQSWNQLILANRKREALDAVQKDLSGDRPHFAACMYWYELSVILDSTDERLQTLDGTSVGKRLKIPVEIFRAYDDERRYSITEKYQTAEGVEDVMALIHLHWASERSESQFAYLSAALERQPELFIGVWQFVTLVQSDYRLHQ